MDALPGPLRVILDWLIMLLGTILTYFGMKNEEDTETSEEA